MAKVEYRVCDRCKNKINDHQKNGAKVKYAKVAYICWRVFQYVSNSTVELCNDCSEGLHQYLYEKKPLSTESEKVSET